MGLLGVRTFGHPLIEITYFWGSRRDLGLGIPIESPDWTWDFGKITYLVPVVVGFAARIGLGTLEK